MESSVDANNIPVSVYTNLIEQVNKNLPTLHRFLELKKRMLGVDELHYYDLYVSMVNSVEMNFTVDEGQQVLLNVFKPLGEEYAATVKNHSTTDGLIIIQLQAKEAARIITAQRMKFILIF